MQLRSSYFTAANLQLCTSSTSLLPFLYQTRTLQAKLLSRKPHRSNSYGSSNRRSFCSTPRPQAPDAKPQSDRNLPFEGIPSDSYDAPSPTASSLPFVEPGRKSTITASEQAIFDRIFEDLSQSSGKEDAAEELLDENHEDEAENEESLQSIFDAAIKNLRLVEDRYVETEELNRLRFTSRPLTPAIGVVSDKDSIWGVPGKIGDDYEDIHTAHREHEMKIYGMLDSAETDIELWQVLETQVFSLVEAFAARQKKTEEERSAASKKTPKRIGRPKKGQKEKEAVAAAATLTLTLPSTSKALPPDILLSILQQNYGSYCLHAMRLLRTQFPTSPYAFRILPSLKRLGPISYVLGASTHLYNELLFLKWAQYSDLHGMADLLVEMGTQGLEANEVTLAVLKAVGRERQRAREGMRGELLRAWWGMGGVAEGWRRVNGLMRTAGREVWKQDVRRTMERTGVEEAGEEGLEKVVGEGGQDVLFVGKDVPFAAAKGDRPRIQFTTASPVRKIAM